MPRLVAGTSQAKPGLGSPARRLSSAPPSAQPTSRHLAGDEQPSAGSSLELDAPSAAGGSGAAPVPVPHLLAPRLVGPNRPKQAADAHEEQVKEYLDWYFENNAAAPGAPQPAGQQSQSAAGAGRPCVHRREAVDAVQSTDQEGPCSLGRAMQEKRYLVVLPAGDNFDANRCGWRGGGRGGGGRLRARTGDAAAS